MTELFAKYIVFLPLVASLITGIFVRVIGDRPSQIITCGAMIAAAVLSGFVFRDVVLAGNTYVVELFTWIHSGDFSADWALKVDSLTSVMFVVVTWVSAVVHVYSVGYMSHDDHKPRFMSYLSLFTFFMLMLVTADNFLQLFLGWEGVGLCSYLLIGFWYKRESANAAAVKAFLVNRVGDFGMLLGVFSTFVMFGSINFEQVFAAVPEKKDLMITLFNQEYHAMTAICVLLFIGCMGKSAQFLLHTWLPDAMEGPTPVSALIHAATMVTAGVFLLVRCSPMFEYAPYALMVVTFFGATTAIFAASVGLVQTDIKKSIAYSTCSQLGYMFFACGVSAYAAAAFHLVTHAFFKALLFLGAGSVIHAMSDEQDMFKMGGIRKLIPITYAFMLIGTLSMVGFPYMSGYFSKEAIIGSAYLSNSPIADYAYLIGVTVAAMTSFYSFRLIFLTFQGKTRADHHTIEHAHEAPIVMWGPLVLLVLGAIGSGYMLEHWGIMEHGGKFWGNAIFVKEAIDVHHVPSSVVMLVGGMGLTGLVLAFVLYMAKTGLPAKIAGSVKPLYNFLVHKWYFDELYDVLFVKMAKRLGRTLWQVFDMRIIDGLGPNGSAWLSQAIAGKVARLQSGYVYHYAFAMLAGLGFVLYVFINSYIGVK